MRHGAPTFDGLEVGLSVFVAVAAQLAFVALLSQSEPHAVRAEVSDDNSKPISVAITPVAVSDLPKLKLGGKVKPGALPDMWQKPRPVVRKTKEPDGSSPSTAADPDAAPVTDAGPMEAGATNDLDAELAAEAPDLDANVDIGPEPSAASSGSPDGVKDGTETDPLKAQAVNLYHAQLQAWFNARFHIRGKIPFDTLKALRAVVVINVTADRRVGGFSVTAPSGNPIFDTEVQTTLSSIQSSGAELPPPPPMYPDILGSSLGLGFSCTTKSNCE